jgi:hypothetical protein
MFDLWGTSNFLQRDGAARSFFVPAACSRQDRSGSPLAQPCDSVRTGSSTLSLRVQNEATWPRHRP